MDASRLKSIPLFASMSDDELGEIAPFASEAAVEEGKRLVSEGEFSYEFFSIEDGQAEVLREGEHVADLGPGDFFGEIGLLERDRRTATVVAKSDMRLITLNGWDMKRMERHVPQAVAQIRNVLEQRRPPTSQ